uniref:Putative glycine rich protein n=1 Tax=Ixodes ricinus TaxID=34613 RepID=A0A0K8R665_IXORI
MEGSERVLDAGSLNETPCSSYLVSDCSRHVSCVGSRIRTKRGILLRFMQIAVYFEICFESFELRLFWESIWSLWYDSSGLDISSALDRCTSK